jgi:lipoprotein-anchoring transpeptidase ErfK/SrfK
MTMKLTALFMILALAGNAAAQETGPALKAQVLLDRAHFSVGEIDGVVGSTTTAAVKQFQQAKNLNVTGELDDETNAALEDNHSVFKTYTLTEKDVVGPFGPDPLYENVEEKLGELFQISPKLLRELNPQAGFIEGETLLVLALGSPIPTQITKIVVTVSDKSLKVYDASNKLLAYYPTTLGDDGSIPYGEWRITSTTRNPYYRRVLPSGKIRAMKGGPNNFVGNIWMALSAKHFGIHGSPSPDKIAKQQSAGCIRLTNWDAAEVAASIAKNVTVVVQR